jgi:hypothetical protein
MPFKAVPFVKAFFEEWYQADISYGYNMLFLFI